MDVIKIDVPTFLRLLELAREEIKNDADLHDLTQAVIAKSQKDVVTMADYDELVHFMKRQGDDELDRIRKLGGM